MRYYTIYCVTNKINHKFYIGMHETENLDDEYIGSGKYLWNAIRKHGIDNFEKEIWLLCSSEQEMREYEALIVSEEFLKENDDKIYNLLSGGKGGYGYINKLGLNDRTGQTFTAEQRKKISESKKGKKCSEETKTKMKQNYWLSRNRDEVKERLSKANRGKSKTLEHRKRISESLRKRKRD